MFGFFKRLKEKRIQREMEKTIEALNSACEKMNLALDEQKLFANLPFNNGYPVWCSVTWKKNET